MKNIIVERSKKIIITIYGPDKIFKVSKDEKDKYKENKENNELNDYIIKKFDSVWNSGLKNTVADAIKKNKLISAEATISKLKDGYDRSKYFKEEYKHYNFMYKGVDFIAQIIELDTSCKVDQLWHFVSSDPDPELFCFKFYDVDEKEKYTKYAEGKGKNPRDLARSIILETISDKPIRTNHLTSDELKKMADTVTYEYYFDVISKFKVMLDEPEKFTETSWQKFIHSNMWMFGVNHTFSIDKVLIEKQKVGFDSIPDFIFPTVDGFFDIIEIKKPEMDVIKKDNSHPGSYYWSASATAAIGQVVNYLSQVDINQIQLTKIYNEKYKNISSHNFLKPRGFILIGNSVNYSLNEKEALRRLNSYMHDIYVLTYFELFKKAENILQFYAKE